MARRNLWDQPAAPANELLAHPAMSPAPVVAPSPTYSPALDLLRVAPVKTRKREWDKQHGKASYRGVPPELQAELKAAAQSLRVTVDELAHALLAYSSVAYQAGDLRLQAVPPAGRLSLFTSANGQPEMLPAAPKRANRKAWQSVVGYRLPDQVRAAVRQTADQLHVPVGEVVMVFLRHALQAWLDGRLKLNPQPLPGRMMLAGDGH